MSASEISLEFVMRARSLYGSEKAAEIFNEFHSLSPREASAVTKAIDETPGSIYHIHAATRVKALVAAGSISPELAAVTEKPQEVVEPAKDEELEYFYSREYLNQELENQTSIDDPYTNLYDKNGLLSRMIARGNSKAEIVSYLESIPKFVSDKNILTGVQKSSEIDGEIKAQKFNTFIDALNGLKDPAEAPDFKAIAKEKISAYDQDGAISQMIDSGATSKDILTELSKNPSWSDAAYDLYTKTDVDISTRSQRDKWAATQDIIFSLKDLDPIA